MNCPMCLTKGFQERIEGPGNREYKLCKTCKLIFTNTRHFNKQLYDIDGLATRFAYPRYIKKVNEAIELSIPYIKPGMIGLDFLCGAAPETGNVLNEKGIDCDNYDPEHYPIQLTRQYDFVFAVNCLERLFFPAKEFAQIESVLKGNNYLIIVTEQWRHPTQFKMWGYAKNPSHVSFFHPETFSCICERYNMSLLFNNGNDIVILRKNGLYQSKVVKQEHGKQIIDEGILEVSDR